MRGRVQNTIEDFYRKHPKLQRRRPATRMLVSMYRRTGRLAEYSRIRLAEKGLRAVKPKVSIAHISMTSDCNFKCRGCMYGRDYLPHQRLDLEVVKAVLADLRDLRVPDVTFYGGEPLLNPDIFEAIAHATRLGLTSSLGTNGSMLTEEHVDRLYSAGLRNIDIGYYGMDEMHAWYVGVEGMSSRIEDAIKYIRAQYEDLRIDFGYLLMKPSCNPESLHEMMSLSKRYGIAFSINLLQYDFPYFSEGEGDELRLREEDRSNIEAFVEELLLLKESHPQLVANSHAGIRAIPDWLMKRAEMKIPCHRYKHVWVGPNGIVRVCQKSTDLGNVNGARLKGLLYTDLHRKAAKGCFDLDCTNCFVSFDERVNLHSSSRRAYQT